MFSAGGVNNQLGLLLSEATSHLSQITSTISIRSSIHVGRVLRRKVSTQNDEPSSTLLTEIPSTTTLAQLPCNCAEQSKNGKDEKLTDQFPLHRDLKLSNSYNENNLACILQDVTDNPSTCIKSEHWDLSYSSLQSFTENKAKLPRKSWIPSPMLDNSRRKLFHDIQKRHMSSMSHRSYSANSYNRNRIEQLENKARQQPNNEIAQAMYLREIVNDDPEHVIKWCESENPKYIMNDDAKNSYMKALLLTDNISVQDAQRRHGGHGGATISLGSKDRPLHVVSSAEDAGKKKMPWLTSALRFTAISAFFFLAYKLYSDPSQLLKGGIFSPNKASEVKPDSSALKFRFSDVHGCEEAKEELQEVVEFLRNPDKFQRLGGHMPKGLLLIGAPGTGKTLLARAIAGEAGVPFFFMTGSEFDEMFVGVGAKRMRELFATAKARAPAIIFIDEIDAVGGKRQESALSPYARQTLNQMLVELDGFEQNEGVVVIGATNFPKSLDPALTRPGRFDSRVTVPLPDVKGRTNLFAHYLKKIPTDGEINSEVLARSTPGFTGADIENVVNQAAIKAASDSCDFVTLEHLDWAKDKVLMGPERKSAVIEPRQMEMTAYHEAGHALVAIFTEDADPIHKATIMPRGQTGGMVQLLPEKDKLNWTKSQLLARIDVAMGGRVAEEIIYGSDGVTEGASSDMEGATQIAQKMVAEYGMSDKIGLMKIESNQKLSHSLRATIEEEVTRILKESYARAKKILIERSKDHKKLALALLKHETLTGEQVKRVLNNKPI